MQSIQKANQVVVAMVNSYEQLFGDLVLPASNSGSGTRVRENLEESGNYSGNYSGNRGNAESDEDNTPLTFTPVLPPTSQLDDSVDHHEEVATPEEKHGAFFPISKNLTPGTLDEDRGMSPRRLMVRTSKRHLNSQITRDDPKKEAAAEDLQTSFEHPAHPPETHGAPEHTVNVANSSPTSSSPTTARTTAIPASWPPRQSGIRAGAGTVSRAPAASSGGTGSATISSGEDTTTGEETEVEETPQPRVFPPRQSKAPQMVCVFFFLRTTY